MSDPLRAFFAVDLPPDVRDAVAGAAEAMRPELPDDVRLAPAGSLHLTLKFLGEVEREQLSRLVRSAAAKLAGTEPFDVKLAGTGAFPDARSARVIWIGVGQGQPALARIARKLDASAGRIGVERDRRPFKGHLSVGRLRRPARVPTERLSSPDLAPFRVEEVVLYESRLSSSGATYIPLTRLPLGQLEDTSIDFAPEF